MSEVTRRLRLLALGIRDDTKRRIAEAEARAADGHAILRALDEIDELIEKQAQEEPTNPSRKSQEMLAAGGAFQKVGAILGEGKRKP